MELKAQTRLDFPRDLVFRTYRDKLPELTAYLPNVSSIVVKDRRDDGPRTKLVNLWTAKTEIPAAAQKFVKPEMLMWHDHAEWDETGWVCHWRIETLAFTEAVECRGRTVYTAVGDRTDLDISADLVLHLDKAKVPRLLAGTVKPVIERIVVSNLKPNLLATGEGIAK
ncbi:MAG: hypothetical protein ACK4N5_25925, partial [Myxococcales bacterium]